MPLLRLTELLHVGKHASFGLGRIEVEVMGRRKRDGGVPPCTAAPPPSLIVTTYG